MTSESNPDPNDKGQRLAIASIILYVLAYLCPGSIFVYGMLRPVSILGKFGPVDITDWHVISALAVLVFGIIFTVAAWVVNGLALFEARYRPNWYIWVTVVFVFLSLPCILYCLIGLRQGLYLIFHSAQS